MDYNVFDYEEIRDNPLSIRVGDRIKMNGYDYIVNRVTYEGRAETIPTVKYECEQLQNWPPLINEPYIPYMNDVVFETLLPINSPIQEEVSKETRKEFMKLLE